MLCRYKFPYGLNIGTGVKKSLVLVPGTSWISGRTSIYFHPMSGGQVKNSMLVYSSLTRTSYLVTGQVKILMYLPGGQVKILRFFYPWCISNIMLVLLGIMDPNLHPGTSYTSNNAEPSSDECAWYLGICLQAY